ncbi:MAG: MerR family transcriptional regulator [Thermodesulfobacteriota bacterium]
MNILADNKLKIGELAKASGLPLSTIRHYINEGLLGKPQKTARNMAYYDQESIRKVSFIKRLQDELRLSIKTIKKIFFTGDDLTMEDYKILLEVKSRLSEDHDLLPEIYDIPHAEVMKHVLLTETEMAAIEKRGAITPEYKKGKKYYDEVDYRLIKALSDFRALGFSADMGINVEALDVYLRLIRELTRSELTIFVDRIARSRSADEIADLLKKGIPAINEVISALHQKFIQDELKRLRALARKKTK